VAYLIDHEDILPVDVVTSLTEARAAGRAAGRLSLLYGNPPTHGHLRYDRHAAGRTTPGRADRTAPDRGRR
jgi:hypothetical protein